MEIPSLSQSEQALQEEMPFAIVQGEPLTILPQDLYIPPDALEVILDANSCHKFGDSLLDYSNSTI